MSIPEGTIKSKANYLYESMILADGMCDSCAGIVGRRQNFRTRPEYWLNYKCHCGRSVTLVDPTEGT